MAKMHAAVVTAFDEPPHYQQFVVPTPGADQELVDVLAVGLHPRVRSAAAGKHYTSTGDLPLIPGVDGIGRMTDGTRVYFVADDELPGPMAERTVVDTRRMVSLPRDVDTLKIAAGMNPAMSSWVALRRRVPLERGQSVLVLGATGNAGTMAVQVAKRLGAGRVVGAGRDVDRLGALKDVGADEVVQITEDNEATGKALGKAASEVDIVIDYLWGNPASTTIMALLTTRSDRGRELNWIQIGAVAGPTLELPSVVLRSANFRLQGVGQGAVSGGGYLAELPSLIDAIDSGTIGVKARALPLQDIEAIWTQPDVPGERIVVVP
ncbi:MAG TPA: zinc-binding alcohol dehydrogenase family protein [Acidimicrobiales bacterium]|nr:zinc-binding alcohol dehydrogenase family protein [Acidimicrobiales bacterium]